MLYFSYLTVDGVVCWKQRHLYVKSTTKNLNLNEIDLFDT